MMAEEFWSKEELHRLWGYRDDRDDLDELIARKEKTGDVS